MFQGSSEEFWRENVYGGLATLVALLFVLACYCAKRFVFRKSSSSKSSPVGVSNSDPTSSGFRSSFLISLLGFVYAQLGSCWFSLILCFMV